MEAHQGLVEDNMKEAEEKRTVEGVSEGVTEEVKESVFEPIAQALKPEVNDNWWETSETTVTNDEDPFA
jgi:hypothetical protein